MKLLLRNSMFVGSNHVSEKAKGNLSFPHGNIRG
jgi:hypothetical protein